MRVQETEFFYYVQLYNVVIVADSSTHYISFGAVPVMCVWFLFLFSFCVIPNIQSACALSHQLFCLSILYAVFHSVTFFRYPFVLYLIRPVASMFILYIYSYALDVFASFLINCMSKWTLLFIHVFFLDAQHSLLLLVSFIFITSIFACLTIKLSSKTCQRHPMFSLHIQ